MAKTKGKAKGVRPRAVRRPAMATNSRLANHIGMIMDPCNAVIGPTAYRGKDGFITRFSATNDWGGSGFATTTCGVYAYWPRYNRIFQVVQASDTAAFSIDFYNATFSLAGPGGAFLGTNAAETRPVAACVRTLYTGTELDKQGWIAQGVIPYNAITGTTSVAQLRQLMQRQVRTPSTVVESKWIPSPYNEDYVKIPATNPSVDSDDNIIIHLVGGFAAGKNVMSHQVVHIQEWQPYYGLGIQVPTPNTADVPAGLERLRSALQTAGNWFLEAAPTARAAVQFARSAYTAYQMVGGQRAVGFPSRPMITEG